MKLGHVGSREIHHTVLLTDALSVGVMRGGDKGITGRTLFQARQHVEDTTAPVVEQENAQVTRSSETTEKPADVESEPSMPFTPRLHHT